MVMCIAAVLLSVVVLVSCGPASAQGKVVSVPAPEGAAVSSDYAVSVNGRPVAVYSAPVWYPTYVKPFGGPYSFASFDFSGRADVQVTTAKPLGHVAVLPEARRIRTTVKGNRLAFSLGAPCQLSIEPDGKNGPLLLFANPLERNVPSASDPKVRYYGPGVHKVGTIELADGETLYLAAGAVVQGGVHARGKGIRICGRGILDGGLWERWKGPNQFMLHLDRCTNATVEGITLKDAWGWVMVAVGCDDVTFTNVKVCSSRCENNDGLDIVNSSKVTMRDSFIRSDDDCIAPKGLGEWMGTGPWPPVEDLTVERCVLWTDRAHVWRLGCESRAAAMRRFVFRDIDVLHYTDPTCPVVSVQPAEDMVMEDVRFENVRIRHEGQAKFLELDPRPTPWAKKQTPGVIRKVLFKDVHLVQPPGAKAGTVVIQGAGAPHAVEDVVFDNVTRGSGRVLRDSPGVSITGDVSRIVFR